MSKHKTACLVSLALVTLCALFGATALMAQPTKALGAEFQVNVYTTAGQRAPSVSKDAGGNFVVTWASSGQDGSLYGIFGRRFDSSGGAEGPDFQINTFTSLSQMFPSVAVNPDGNFVVVWSSNGQDGANYGIFGRRFDATGTAQAVEFQVNAYTAGFQAGPAVAINASGAFVVTWNSDGQDGSVQGVFGRRFNAAGSPLAAEFQVHSYTTNQQFRSWPLLDSAGGFVVSWQSTGQDGASDGIFARRFNSSGSPLAVEFQVNTYTTGQQRLAAAGIDQDGDFVITWESEAQDGSYTGIFARRFNSPGTALAAEFRVNGFTLNYQENPRIAVDPTGGFVVAWKSKDQDGAGYGIFGRRFSSSGVAIASEFQVNSHTQGDQQYPAVTADADGDFVVAWESVGQDGDGRGVFAQSYTTRAVLDIDGNGETGALTDGLLVLRFLFGFTGTTLTNSAVDVGGCTRCDATAITAYLNTLV